MHEYTMGYIGEFIKDNYCPENMNKGDLEELYVWSKSFKNILEGDYYYHVIEAMETHSTEETMNKLEEYSPEMQKYYRDMDLIKSRMYYSSMTSENCGTSATSRAAYIESADSDAETKMAKLKRYALDLMSDITEMLDLGKASAEEKEAIKQWLNQYASKL